jgi:hypothetical protein
MNEIKRGKQRYVPYFPFTRFRQAIVSPYPRSSAPPRVQMAV